jgi:LuxR family glucitol operon transcriptional activator
MLPLTRTYSKAELSTQQGLETDLREKWLDYYLSFLSQQEPRYENLNTVSLEIKNLESALDWCLHSNRLVDYVNLLKSLNFFFLATGNWNTWNRYLQNGPDIAASIEAYLEQANFLAWLASMRYYQDRLDEAENYIRKAIDIYQQKDEKAELALSLRRLASIQIKLGQNEGARSNLDNALKFARAVNNERYISRIQRQVAKLDIDDGKLEDAKQRLYEAKELRENNTQVSSGLTYIYRLLGQIALKEDNLNDARRNFNRSLDIGERIKSQHDVAEAKQGLAQIEYLVGQEPEARRLLVEAIDSFRNLGMQRELKEAEILLGKLSLE